MNKNISNKNYLLRKADSFQPEKLSMSDKQTLVSFFELLMEADKNERKKQEKHSSEKK